MSSTFPAGAPSSGLKRTTVKGTVVAAGVALAVLLSGCGGGSSASAGAEPAQSVPPAVVSASPTATSTSAPSGTGEPLEADAVISATGSAPNVQPAYATRALDLLAKLPVKGRAPKTGYARDQFGPAWADVDHNGCDTRNDILLRDFTSTVFRDGTKGCVIASGTLDDPYTGTTIGFVRGNGTSTAVQIDHVVALSDAWQTGAQQLSPDQRTVLANDPLNLLAVDGPTNEAKGDGDAATWLPPNKSYRCQYVARQVAVKATYSLWVTQAEHDAIARVLASCPDQQVPTDQKAPAKPVPAPAAPAPVAPAPVQPAPAAPAPAPVAPAPAGVYYASCAAARAAGAAPLYAGQPGYRTALDRDRDGVACE